MHVSSKKVFYKRFSSLLQKVKKVQKLKTSAAFDGGFDDCIEPDQIDGVVRAVNLSCEWRGGGHGTPSNLWYMLWKQLWGK